MAKTLSAQKGDPGQSIPEKFWEKLVACWAMTRLGHEGFMLGKIQKQARMAQQCARFSATGDAAVFNEKDNDDDGVNIGNETHNHIQKSSGLVPHLATFVGGSGLAAAAVMWALSGQPDDGTATQPPAVVAPSPAKSFQWDGTLEFPGQQAADGGEATPFVPNQ